MDKEFKTVQEKIKEKNDKRDKKIRRLYFVDKLSMDEICIKEGHSKTTVFFAIKGRPKNKTKS